MLKTIEECGELALMADNAEECLGTFRFGSHYALIKYLKNNHGIIVHSSQDAIKAAKRLCNEFMMAYNAE